MVGKGRRIRSITVKILLIVMGSVISSIGLEIFLVPNNIIAGGVIGISIISIYLSGLPLGIFTFLLNLPFSVIGYK